MMGLRLRGMVKGRSLATDSRNGLLKAIQNDDQSATTILEKFLTHVWGLNISH